MKAGDDNILAIRLDNPLDSSRWYPGAGIYRNVWLVKVDTTHVGQYAAYITTPSVSAQSAALNLIVEVENKGTASRQVDVVTEVRVFDPAAGRPTGDVVATFPRATANVAAGAKQSVNGSTTVKNPLLWGPAPAQKPNLYVAVTTLLAHGTATRAPTRLALAFGPLGIDRDKGVSVNGQLVRIQGTCNHHDQGSLGAAFHVRAAERQLQMLQEMGGNALRTSHNPARA